MNEQIFKLALKAMDFQGAVDINTELKLTNSELTKFAELIVGECYLWVKENGGLGCEEDFEALKEHFGVEE